MRGRRLDVKLHRTTRSALACGVALAAAVGLAGCQSSAAVSDAASGEPAAAPSPATSAADVRTFTSGVVTANSMASGKQTTTVTAATVTVSPTETTVQASLKGEVMGLGDLNITSDPSGRDAEYQTQDGRWAPGELSLYDLPNGGQGGRFIVRGPMDVLKFELQ